MRPGGEKAAAFVAEHGPPINLFEHITAASLASSAEQQFVWLTPRLRTIVCNSIPFSQSSLAGSHSSVTLRRWGRSRGDWGLCLAAEFKRASPSKGDIAVDADVAEQVATGGCQ